MNNTIPFLLTEVLYGTTTGAEGTTFIPGDEALVHVLETLTFEQAVHRPASGLPNIADHLTHVNAYLAGGIASFQGNELDIDWPATWQNELSSKQEFQAEIDRLKSQADEFLALAETADLSNEWAQIDAVANVCHLAYHFGAIRCLYGLAQLKA